MEFGGYVRGDYVLDADFGGFEFALLGVVFSSANTSAVVYRELCWCSWFCCAGCRGLRAGAGACACSVAEELCHEPRSVAPWRVVAALLALSLSAVPSVTAIWRV